MKILGIVGSLRKKSYNRQVFQAYATMLAGRAELIEGRIIDIPLYNDDVREAGVPESVQRLCEQIKTADGVIFFSPEYNYSIPGVLKNAIDWVSKVPPVAFAGKTTSIISASPGKLGGARMQYELRKTGVALEMLMLNRPEMMISEVHKKVDGEGKITDADTSKYLGIHIEKFLAALQSRV